MGGIFRASAILRHPDQTGAYFRERERKGSKVGSLCLLVRRDLIIKLTDFHYTVSYPLSISRVLGKG